ncbi:MAG: phosphatase PAP2 family protein [Patescibacteria group bacterium]
MSFSEFMIFVSKIGSPQSITILCIVLGIFLLSHKKIYHFFQFVIFMSLGGGSVWLLKQWFQIPRPVDGIIQAPGYSFPSGHAAMATLFFFLLTYSYLSHVKSRTGKFFLIIAGLGVPMLVSYSRIYLGVHTFNDVVGGICLGTFWFLLSVIFYTRISVKRGN